MKCGYFRYATKIEAQALQERRFHAMCYVRLGASRGERGAAVDFAIEITLLEGMAARFCAALLGIARNPYRAIRQYIDLPRKWKECVNVSALPVFESDSSMECDDVLFLDTPSLHIDALFLPEGLQFVY